MCVISRRNIAPCPCGPTYSVLLGARIHTCWLLVAASNSLFQGDSWSAGRGCELTIDRLLYIAVISCVRQIVNCGFSVCCIVVPGSYHTYVCGPTCVHPVLPYLLMISPSAIVGLLRHTAILSYKGRCSPRAFSFFFLFFPGFPGYFFARIFQPPDFPDFCFPPPQLFVKFNFPGVLPFKEYHKL